MRSPEIGEEIVLRAGSHMRKEPRRNVTSKEPMTVIISDFNAIVVGKAPRPDDFAPSSSDPHWEMILVMYTSMGEPMLRWTFVDNVKR